jgi:hypothetical protein
VHTYNNSHHECWPANAAGRAFTVALWERRRRLSFLGQVPALVLDMPHAIVLVDLVGGMQHVDQLENLQRACSQHTVSHLLFGGRQWGAVGCSGVQWR